ncbi:hypothetical protein GCM10018790_75440 [Kitasatospora xanthocidica]|nr:hypothetical protein GCM10018790_75440 [Kitasatospora xanthocidica]
MLGARGPDGKRDQCLRARVGNVREQTRITELTEDRLGHAGGEEVDAGVGEELVGERRVRVADVGQPPGDGAYQDAEVPGGVLVRQGGAE